MGWLTGNVAAARARATVLTQGPEKQFELERATAELKLIHPASVSDGPRFVAAKLAHLGALGAKKRTNECMTEFTEESMKLVCKDLP